MHVIKVETYTQAIKEYRSSHTKQGRIHGSISHARWAGALMEVKSLFGLNSAIKKNGRRTDGPTNRRTDGWTDHNIEMRGRI